MLFTVKACYSLPQPWYQLVTCHVAVQERNAPLQQHFPELLRQTWFWLKGDKPRAPNGHGLCKWLVMTLLKSGCSVSVCKTPCTHTHIGLCTHARTHAQEERQRGSQGTSPWGIACHRVCVCWDVGVCVRQGSCRQRQSCMRFQLHTYRRCVSLPVVLYLHVVCQGEPQ